MYEGIMPEVNEFIRGPTAELSMDFMEVEPMLLTDGWPKPSPLNPALMPWKAEVLVLFWVQSLS